MSGMPADGSATRSVSRHFRSYVVRSTGGLPRSDAWFGVTSLVDHPLTVLAVALFALSIDTPREGLVRVVPVNLESLAGVMHAGGR